jgi:hypothetical protein
MEPYKPLASIFYQRARKYMELDEMKSFGEFVCTAEHIQTWALLYLFEAFNAYLVRSFLSERKAAALCIACGYHKLDSLNSPIVPYQPPAEDWTQLEERRRIFWVIYMHDRYVYISTSCCHLRLFKSC